MIFQDQPTVKVTSKISGTTNKISMTGITANAFTPEEAQTQLNKILDIIGISVLTSGMTRTRTEEAVDNG